MGLEDLRNVVTGEHKQVETNSDEYFELINERYDHDGSARPTWEITGAHHTARVDSGEVQHADMGEQYKPVPGAVMGVDVGDLGPEPHPEQALTEGEVESGITSWDQKQKELAHVVEDTSADAKLERVAPDKRVEEGTEAAGSSTSRGSRRRKAPAKEGAGSSS
jgi:hypothetical protein